MLQEHNGIFKVENYKDLLELVDLLDELDTICLIGIAKNKDTLRAKKVYFRTANIGERTSLMNVLREGTSILKEIMEDEHGRSNKTARHQELAPKRQHQKRAVKND